MADRFVAVGGGQVQLAFAETAEFVRVRELFAGALKTRPPTDGSAPLAKKSRKTA